MLFATATWRAHLQVLRAQEALARCCRNGMAILREGRTSFSAVAAVLQECDYIQRSNMLMLAFLYADAANDPKFEGGS